MIDRLSSLAFVAALGLFPLSAAAQEAHGAATPHFTYSGEHGPEAWGSLSHDWAVCASGQSQSPIDLAGPVAALLPPIRAGWTPAKARVVNNGHTIQVEPVGDAGGLTFDGTDYAFRQVHFHHRSEHAIDGQHTDMEAHFVHQAEDGRYLVVGLFMEGAAAATPFATLFGAAIAGAPAPEGEPVVLAAAIDPGTLLGDLDGLFSYQGSLTTPPCSQTVTWVLQAQPVPVEAADVAGFVRIIGDNARPLQPVYDRTVALD